MLVCSYGNRSKPAAGYLLKNGFSHVSHLQNGIESLDLTAYKNDRQA
jgi:rhodanese-related sulfurtransferase